MPNLEDMLAEQAVQGTKITSIENTCTEIKDCLLGNGKLGLVLRTDRLEQKDKFKTRLFWTILAAIVVLAVEIIAISLSTGFIKTTIN